MKDFIEPQKTEHFKLDRRIVETLIEYSPIGYILLDYNLRIQYMNRSYACMYALSQEKVIGATFQSTLQNESAAELELAKSVVASNQKRFMTMQKQSLVNAKRYIDLHMLPVQDKTKNQQYIMGIVMDRTSEKAVQIKIERDYEEIISIFTLLLDAKDTYTALHSHNVRNLAMRLAKTLDLHERDIFEISLAASLHDIGKLSIPYEIINKPGVLNEEEYALIKNHPIISYHLLEGLKSFRNIQKIVRSHHERIDGKGYPDGLKGNEIPLGAKIVAIADTYDAITSTRSYHQAAPHEEALKEIKRVSGAQLDEQIADVFVHMNFDHLDVIHDESYIQQQPLKFKENKMPHDSEVFYHMAKFDAEPLLYLIMDHTPCGYIFVDRKFKIQYVNAYYLKYGGYEGKDVLGRACFDVHKLGSEHCLQCSILQAMQTKAMSYVQKEITMSSGLRIFDLFGVPILDDKHEVSYVVGVLVDRTSQVLAQRYLKQDFEQLLQTLSYVQQDVELGLHEHIEQEEYQKLKEYVYKILIDHEEYVSNV